MEQVLLQLDKELADDLGRAARKELDRELGSSRNWISEVSKEPNARQKAVQELAQQVVQSWSDVPDRTTPLPEEQGLRDHLKRSQLAEAWSFEMINYLTKLAGGKHEPVHARDALRLA